MTDPAIVDSTRSSLSPVGFALPSVGLTAVPTATQQRTAARRLEAAGYVNGWANEVVGGKDVFVQLAILLGETERLVFGTSIAPMWSRPAVVLHAAAHQLSDAFPGRFLLGVGAGYELQATLVGLDYSKPLTKLREYIGRMAEPNPMLEHPSVNYATLLAANGRKAIVQAGEIADGAYMGLVPPFYVAEARATLGPDKLVVVGLTTFFGEDKSSARAAAAASITATMSFPGSPYARSIAAMGYSADEMADGSDRLVDDLTAHGPAESITAAAERYLAAGADHVVLIPVADTFDSGVDGLVAVAPAVTGQALASPDLSRGVKG